MIDKPPPPDDPADAFTPRAAILFTAGLALYGVGFILLTRGHGDLAPMIVVGGIVTMVWALL